MAEDWASDVKIYAPDADDTVIAGIVRYCGIALRNRDSSLVSFSDPAETARVRDNFCRKKLGLTAPDAEVDAAIARVGERMKGDGTRNRVTVYYLLAQEFGKLDLFRSAKAAAGTADAVGAAAASATVAAAAPAAAATPLFTPAAAAPAPAPRPVAAPLAAASRPAAAAPAAAVGGGSDGTISTALIAAGVLGVGILIAATVGSLAGHRLNGAATTAPSDPPPDFSKPATAAVEPAAAAPQGAAVVAEERAGKPALSVYFDTGKSDIAADFAATAAPVKAWVDSHPGARLAVSGFNDPTGNAAANAELSKNRAKAVAAALTEIGIPAGQVTLQKPAETTDTTTSAAEARRVEVTVLDAS